MGCHSEKEFRIPRTEFRIPRVAPRMPRNSPRAPRMAFRSESVFPEIGVVPRLLTSVLALASRVLTSPGQSFPGGVESLQLVALPMPPTSDAALMLIKEPLTVSIM